MIDFTPIARFGLLLVRPAMLVMVSPVFGGLFIPTMVRIGFAVLLSVALLPLVSVPLVVSEVALGVIVLHEMAVGLAMGLAVRAFVAGAEMAGGLSAIQLGYSYGSVVDPQSGVRNNQLAVIYANLALLTFFATNSHHALIRTLVSSYAILPIGVGHINASLVGSVTGMFGLVFVLGVRLAMPIIVVLLMVELAMGLLSRAAPSLNLMVVGAPMRLAVGLVVLAAIIPVAPALLARFSTTALELAAQAAKAFR